ncbi:TPA: autotransporter outer membrane beta-barrel domain-containing protein [Citrobacter amalonaticus]|uniref:autotransporter outer membrane beta-barrel domain-containing protein n=1 Tax=Citrobacter amalonaticus TaxID=35703 RepID=UPI000B7C6840|nr:autotransporter outer membrane beta-barrel domain-containing protein [Citrobacter amalonaticus]HAU5591512.1 autotransporter outer membrane beta-barrel domain-containing protein [Citrobacter amalonaticus]HDP8880788.1 autotransporter outer membrane beta-barrel domain-containing protein [Citrobacter amalonaticus]
MKIKYLHHPKSMLAIAVALTVQTAAAANVDNINLLAVTPPTGGNSIVLVNNNDTLTLSNTENTESYWNNFSTLRVGDASAGSMIIDGRDILTTTGAEIGRAATGSVTLTNGATWELNNSLIQIGLEGGTGILNVHNGSKITGIAGLRVGEFYETGEGLLSIDGANSSVATNHIIVGDQNHGKLLITNGGKLSTTEHMSIGYVGVTDNSNRNGFGETLVDGAGSTLDVATAINLGGFSTANNTAKGILTVSNGATVKSGSLIRLAYGNGSTGILNIGGAQGEAEQAAGNIEASRIYLMNNSGLSTALLNFNHSSQDFVLASRIYGNGEVNHVGSGITTLTGANTYSGNTLVSRGTLRAGAENTFSAASDYTVSEGSSLDLNGYSQTLNSLDLAGTATLSSPSQARAAFTPTTLTIAGNYAGNNGLLALRTVLGDDLSATDKLVVRGDTSGTTRVSVTNAGGGSQTVEGIPIVEVEGASNGTFVKEGRIVAGAYDYNIIKKNNQNWHLTSEAIPDPLPPDEPAPASPETPEQPIPQPGEHQYRPETGSYLANTLAANTLFTTRLHDRLGETQYTDVFTGEQKVTSLWMRHVGGHNRFKDSSGQISTQSNRYVMQLGGDIAQWSTDGLDRWHLGLMAGYANSKSRSHSSLTGYSSRGEISGYSAGLYGTWYANDADKTGAYVDGWLLYNWFDNTVSGQGLASEKYDSDGITASVETGYTWKLAEFSERNALYIQPKAQITWMDVQADTHVEKNGTRVVDKTDGNLQTRLGVKAYLQGHNAMDDGKDRTFQPFVEVNWIHNTQNYSVQMDDISNDVKGSRNIGELKAGVEGQLTKNVTLWGNVAQQIGDNGYKDTQGMLGLKYSF